MIQSLYGFLTGTVQLTYKTTWGPSGKNPSSQSEKWPGRLLPEPHLTFKAKKNTLKNNAMDNVKEKRS